MTTHDEQERVAYVEGDTERAALLARIADLEDYVAELLQGVLEVKDDRIAQLGARIDELEHDLDVLEHLRYG